MSEYKFQYYLINWKSDLLAGLVVFLVALPLCLGIAIASGAPPFAGIIAGIVGGLIVSLASGSQLSVSGPANGVTIVAAAAIASFGYKGLLAAIVIAGSIQVALGFLKAGVISAYFPSSVVRGMMAAIGILLMMKQMPHALGYDDSAEDDVSFLEESTSSDLFVIKESLNSITPGAILLTLICLGILILWDTKLIKNNKIFSLIPSPLIVVLFGATFNIFTQAYFTSLAILPEHLVNLPVFENFSKIFSEITLPEFSFFLKSEIIFTGITLALIASIESLLSLEAADKLDPLRRVAPADRELLAQGFGNIISGFLGGLPISAVIVRSSVNINAGAHTKLASFTHGVLIFISIFLFSHILNMIPLACLAAILVYTGFKLAKPSIFIQMYKEGFDQFLPFLITIISMILFDSLRGVIIGVVVGLLFIIRNNYHAAFTLTQQENSYLLRLNKDVSFINKAPLRNLLRNINPNSYVIIDGSRAGFVDKDILETISDFVKSSNDDGITVELKNIPSRIGNV